MSHVLVVDDDDRIRKLLSRYLCGNGYFVITANNGSDAIEIMKRYSFDIVISDVMMPVKDGFELTEEIKRIYPNMPVILLTALGEIDDRVKGLELGADDYLPKPFEPRELVLRIKAVLRRYDTVENKKGNEFSFGNWLYDANLFKLKLGDREVKLTSGENQLLLAMSKNMGFVMSREQLAMACNLEASDRTIDVQITRLRKKIEDDPKEPEYIITVRGKGYMLRN